MQTLHRLSKWLGFLALAGYVVVAVAFAALRYWVVPNIDRWREPLQRELSALLEDPVELGQVRADMSWSGLRLRLGDTRVRDDQGRLLIRIPSLDLVLAWRDLLGGNARLLNLRAEGVDVALQRDAQNNVTLLGYAIEGDDEGDDDDAVTDIESVYWLSRQGDVQLTNARIRWIDEARNAPPLIFEDVTLAMGARDDDLVFTMTARPPAELGRSFAMQGRLHIPEDVRPQRVQGKLSGRFHVHVQGMRPASWQPWLDVHSALREGEVSWRGWQEMVDGSAGHHVSEIRVSDGRWHMQGAAEVSVETLRLFVQGPWQSIQNFWSEEAAPATQSADASLRVAFETHGLQVDVPDVLTAPLRFDAIALSAGLTHAPDTGLRVGVDRLQLRNPDMDLDVQGSWQQVGAGDLGLVDLHGRFLRAEFSAIERYLPRVVDDDARAWMRNGLLAGRLVDGPVRLAGDLAYFPFGEHPDKGDFEVGGAVEGVVIDYAPAALVGEPGWPRIENLHGHASLHRVELRVRGHTMQMRPEGKPVDFTGVEARINNIEEDSVLEVSGTGRAPAATVLTFLRASPVGASLDNAFVQAQGEGNWQVPLSLHIPLTGTQPIRVAGALEVKDASLSLADTLPTLSNLSGRIEFTESLLKAHDLKGRLLGDVVSISGGIGKGEKGLVFEGRLTSEALADVLGERFKPLLDGATPYRFAIQRSPEGAYDLRLDASLEGLAIDAPAPLGKDAAARRPLQVRWVDRRKGDASLDISLAAGMQARFLHREGAKGPFFHSGAINLNGSAKTDQPGLAIDVTTPHIDLDAWREFTDGFGQAESGAPALPPLRSLRMQAQSATLLGTQLDQMTFTVGRAEGGRWRVDVSSTQTAGTLFWRERDGTIQGDVDAKFERLALGAEHSKEDAAGSKAVAQSPTLAELQREIDFPAIRLQVDRLRLYGRDVGSLSVVGVNETHGRHWTLQELKLASPHGVLHGNGAWRLEGEQRGLTVQAQAEFHDLGAWLDMAGFTDLMGDGKGRVEGRIEWRDVPWQFDRARLNGELSVDLADGRFITLGSRSARLLELLSLQSVKRFATLDWKPGGLLKQGFPFDSVQGRITMHDGILHSENYRVTGPVATIMIAGDVDLPREMLDLYAIVIPNLDVSGAAIAAGLAVNPVVGLGAFLTQWLLKAPLGKAMAVEYRVKGAFDAPEVDEISTRGGGEAGSATQP